MKKKEVSEQFFLQNRRRPNPEGSCFHKTGGVPILKDLTLAIPEGSQYGGVSILLIRSGPNFANPEGYFFVNPEGYCFCLRT